MVDALEIPEDDAFGIGDLARQMFAFRVRYARNGFSLGHFDSHSVGKAPFDSHVENVRDFFQERLSHFRKGDCRDVRAVRQAEVIDDDVLMDHLAGRYDNVELGIGDGRLLLP